MTPKLAQLAFRNDWQILATEPSNNCHYLYTYIYSYCFFCVHLSTYLSVHLSICRSFDLLICLSIYLSIYSIVFIYQTIHPSQKPYSSEDPPFFHFFTQQKGFASRDRRRGSKGYQSSPPYRRSTRPLPQRNFGSIVSIPPGDFTHKHICERKVKSPGATAFQ